MCKETKEYYECPHCGSDRFVRMYNVWNEEFRLKLHPTEKYEDGTPMWNGTEELGVEKDHLYGYICADCRKDAEELNEGL